MSKLCVLLQSIIFYTIRSTKLTQWLSNEAVQQGLKPYMEANFVDVDPTFHVHVDEDYDTRSCGVSKHSFCHIYRDWIVHCANRGHLVSKGHNSYLVFETTCISQSCLCMC